MRSFDTQRILVAILGLSFAWQHEAVACAVTFAALLIADAITPERKA